MSESHSPRRVLHLIIEGFPPERQTELVPSPQAPGVVIEIFPLTESNASEALKKIFAAETVNVWGPL
jgi:hypothetical protein